MADDEDGLDALRERLKSHSSCFNSLLELIPPKYYFPDNEEKQGEKFYKNKKNKAPKQAIKEASKKAKMSRLDPSKHKSVLELQTESSRSESKKSNSEHQFSVEDVRCSDIGNLRGKLHERIELLRKKRKASEIKPQVERPAKKFKRKLKGEKSNKKTAPSISKSSGKDVVNGKKPITTDEGKLVFSKFDFTSDVGRTETTRKGKAKRKNYKKLLEKAEDRKKKLEELRANNVDEAKKIVEKETWRKALGKSQGQKPKDDPAMVKKSMKRKEKQKNKHRREWKERVESQMRQMKDKQERRERNIKERTENKKKKKIKKKFGRTPGF